MLHNLHFIVGWSYVCLKVMYNKCHMSLTLEMCTTHEISDIIESVQKMSCVLILQMYMKCKISGYVQEMCSKCHNYVLDLGNVQDTTNFCTAGNVQEIFCVLPWNCKIK